MDNFMRMANIQVIMFLYMAIGFFCWRKKIINPASLQSFIDFLLSISLPCMIFNSFNQQLTMDLLKASASALALAGFAAVLGLLLAKVMFRRYPKERQSILRYGTLVNACTFSGLPLVNAIYAATGMFYGSIYIIPNRILMWTAGLSIFIDMPAGQRFKKVILNPNIIAVFLGVLRMILQPTLPDFLDTTIKNIGSISSPLSLVIVGAILAQAELRQMFSPGILPLCLARLVLIPGAVLIVARLCGADPVVTGVGVLLSAMPIGATTALFSAKYGADAAYGSAAVFITTLLSLITVPLFALLL